MKLTRNFKQLTSLLISNLQKAGYEINQATSGWHLHKGNIYYGSLQYKPVRGWQGSALHHLPQEVLEKLNKIS
jgi:hypothetical protein